MTYHDESYNERMEAQHGVYDGNEPSMLFPSDVDAALRRIERYLGDRPWGWWGVLPLKQIITEERERMGLPKEANV